ncbi:SMP-30/gluconolactonase/LRE family protein [Alteromonadaceae bacterium BrNp21-10]|nr:SMP-30/gluconolactonase/LRE family protein [Alteromonadaceae bacterium BrNp21-10]
MNQLTSPLNNLRLLHDSQCQLGEGPLWVAEENAVYWVDIIGKRLHKVQLDGTSHQQWQFDSEISSIIQRQQGGFIASFRWGFGLLELPSGKITPIDSPESDDAGNRYNDAKTDPQGNIWAGTMDCAEGRQSGVLYRLTPDLTFAVKDQGYSVTNGPAFSADGKYLYHADTLKGVIYRFCHGANGELSDKHVFVKVDAQLGYPDGMTVDADNRLWVCHFSGAQVSVYSSTGKLLASIPMPVTNITSCTFVGEGLDKIVFTTARIGLSAKQLVAQPNAGGIFIADVNVKGIAVAKFAG